MFDLNSLVSPDGALARQRRAGQRALHRRRALHAFGRDLRGTPSGTRAGGDRPGPRHGLPGWRLARASATIDPLMVPEPALPVVRRAGARDVDAMAAQMARTFWDDPVSSYIFRNGRAPGRGPARLLPHPDAGRLPPLRRVLHDRRLRRLGDLGSRRQAVADRPPGDLDHGARAAVRGDQRASRRCGCSTPSRRCTPTSRTGTWPAWARRSTSRARAWGAR